MSQKRLLSVKSYHQPFVPSSGFLCKEFPLAGHIRQHFWGNLKVFADQLRDIMSRTCPKSASGPIIYLRPRISWGQGHIIIAFYCYVNDGPADVIIDKCNKWFRTLNNFKTTVLL